MVSYWIMIKYKRGTMFDKVVSYWIMIKYKRGTMFDKNIKYKNKIENIKY